MFVNNYDILRESDLGVARINHDECAACAFAMRNFAVANYILPCHRFLSHRT